MLDLVKDASRSLDIVKDASRSYEPIPDDISARWHSVSRSGLAGCNEEQALCGSNKEHD
jgi:hypothetical protein